MKQNPKSKKLKVLVALSGGVDSSVAALLKKRKGYDVVAAFMKNWSDTKNQITGECNWREERRMASKIAAKLDIPLITLDYEKQYKKEVVDDMFKKYKQGITPNPDVDCNQKIKFPNLIKEAEKLGCDFIVTGHYARIKKVRGLSFHRAGGRGSAAGKDAHAKYKMLRGKDESKDQSYFLYRINQKELSRVLFPIGDYTKVQIRQIAKRAGFPNFNKKSTVGICFIGKINLKDFLSKKIKPKKGNIINPRGEIIGQHDGIYYYTIGQRLGPRYGFDVEKNTDDKHNLNRWYVARKDAKKNLIVAAPEGHPLLYRKNIVISDPHWISGTSPLSSALGWVVGAPRRGTRVYSRIRQVGELIPSKLSYNKKAKKFQVKLKRAITGVSEGQAIVLYKGKEVLGGGVIGF